MDKATFLQSLENVLRNLVFGHVLLGIGCRQDVSYLEREIITFADGPESTEVALRPLFTGVHSLPSQRPVLLGEFQKMLRRAAVAETFELLRYYGQQTAQDALIKAAPWYDVARIVRNTTSHGLGGELSWPPEFKKKRIKSVSWGNMRFDESMEGKEIPLPTSDIVRLLMAVREFAAQQLK